MKGGRVLWWMILIRGIALLLLGLLAIAWPGLTLLILAYFFALYVLVAGIINTISGIVSINKRRGWFLSLLLGIIELGVGVYVLRIPGLPLALFIAVIGFTFMVQGILEIIVAFADRDVGTRVLEIITGILGVIAGFFILRYPLAGGIAFVWVIGIYGLIGGAIRIAIALSVYAEEEAGKVAPAKR